MSLSLIHILSARIKQYGILRAIGMDDAQLKRMISAEAGTYAVSGLVVGIALGLVLNRKMCIRDSRSILAFALSVQH